MESKQQIYDLMPDGSYPKTLYCPKDRPVVAICISLTEKGLVFPLIAKPDIGQRGMQVSLLRNECELYIHSARSKVDFLLQEYIAYPNEAGIFYYRYPGQSKGRISVIVGKEMLAVNGDGRSTVEQWSSRLTPALEEAIDSLCRQVPGFYFGRLDIKFDPRHSIFFAWKEIIRHWRLLFDISRANTGKEGLAPMSTVEGLKMLRDYARHEKLIS